MPRVPGRRITTARHPCSATGGAIRGSGLAGVLAVMLATLMGVLTPLAVP